MIKSDAWFLPDGEQHLPEMLVKMDRRVDGRLTYQYTKYEMALAFVKCRRVAIDVGAHVGLWSWFMARDFDSLVAFEPMPEHQLCWFENMRERANADLYQFALGDCAKQVRLGTRTKGSSGDTGIEAQGEILADQITLDSREIPNVDFIKIDCEGYEEAVLRGAEKTLLTWKPVVVVEQKYNMAEKYGFKKLGAVDYLKSLGAVKKGEISGDFIMAWDD